MKVSIIKCFSYNQKEVDKKIQEVISSINNIDRIIKPKTTVLLKVNLLMPKEPEYAITTHPAVVEAVAKLLKDINCEVIIGDSSSWQTQKALKVCGMEEVAKKTAAKIINFDAYKPKKVRNKEAKVLKEFFISPVILDIDYIISLCKLKVHEFTLFTGGVKNMFGCIPGRYKKYIHSIATESYKFAECLVDIYSSYCKPNFTIMDAVYGLEGSATTLGKPRKINLILASDDAGSLDTVASYLIDYKPYQLPQNIALRKRHIDGSYLNEIEIIADEELEKLKIKDFRKPSTLLRFATKRFFFFLEPKIYPRLNKDKCIKCGLCSNSCPVEGIKFQKGGYPKFNYNKCIRCYCCSEVCQQAAIEINVPFLWRTVS